ncbi:hypothetical protein DFH08DRAFT_797994 [Mycena albidolilacea]|uniref:Uncharacterized protein n=1 Tax=Mycena albidolilacea TaxID=1033008 RepID=A0AAD7AST5_9AGAR|nr:hypothetical protein DFH08DRAFT_797994 [Mycena albidolilacea]
MGQLWLWKYSARVQRGRAWNTPVEAIYITFCHVPNPFTTHFPFGLGAVVRKPTYDLVAKEHAPRDNPRNVSFQVVPKPLLHLCYPLPVALPFFLAVWRAGHTDLHYPCVDDFWAKKRAKAMKQHMPTNASKWMCWASGPLLDNNGPLCTTRSSTWYSALRVQRAGPGRRARDLPPSRGEALADLEVVQLEFIRRDGHVFRRTGVASVDCLHINLAIDEWKGENGVVDL